MNTIVVSIEEYSEDGKTLFCSVFKDKDDFDIHINVETLEVSIHTNGNFEIEELSEFTDDMFKINLLTEILRFAVKNDCITNNEILVTV